MKLIEKVCKFVELYLNNQQMVETKEEPKEVSTVKQFTKKSGLQLSNNFNSNEFDCKCKGNCYQTILDKRLVDRLQLIRDELGLPLVITSAYRCVQHNRNVGGSPTSTHMEGIAVDLWCDDLDKLAQVIEEVFPENSIGRYNNFLHFDIREDGRRWDFRK